MLFFTNTDSKSPNTVYDILRNYGFHVNREEIYTPINALKEFLINHPDKKIYLVTTKEIEKEFQEFRIIRENEIPDYVIIGDFRDNWDVNRLNDAFQFIKQGAILLGTQGNIYFLDRSGKPVIDTGSFVQMVAKAANIEPKIYGKPSKQYFEQAINILKVSRDNIIVIGDDYNSDIEGAFKVNLKTILVQTGKGKYFNENKTKRRPDLIIPSFSSLKDYI